MNTIENTQEWHDVEPETSFSTEVIRPLSKTLDGFDVATFLTGTSPEGSTLSCNALAVTLPLNEHCLFRSFDEARRALAC